MANLNTILHVARSNMLSNLFDLDIVSSNLANFNTIGYKANRGNFQEMLNAQKLHGVQLRATQRLMQQGSLRESLNPYDLAIEGEGFFAVTLPDNRTAYTRDGQFGLDANRRIVNANGFPLVWQGQIPQDALEIQVYPNGNVMALQGNTWNQVGTVQLTRFANPSGLQGFGQNLWLATNVSGQAQTGPANAGGNGLIRSRMLEASNVNVATEMTEMVNLQRSFQMSQRTFTQTDQMIAEAIQMRR